MSKYKRIFSVLLILVLVVALAGCGQTEDPEEAETPAETEETEEAEEKAEEIKIAMVTDEGGVNDQSFNQSAWEGLQEAEKDLGVKVSYVESEQDSDFEPNFETVYDAGNDLIWGIGFKLSDAVLEAAETNPDQNYAIIDFSYGDDTPDNVVGVLFKQEQPSFLVGYIAGKMTETGKVGFIGGIEGDVIHAFDAGFQAGVKHANKDVEILRQYVEDFSDAGKAKGIATQMYNQGADIIFHAAGAAGDGLIEAAKELDKWAIGVDRDQNYMAPDNVLTSAMKRVDVGVYRIAEDIVNGEFPGGETVVYGLEEEGVDIAPTSDKHVPEEILEEIEELKKQIIDGDIVVPATLEDAEKYIDEL